MFKYGLISGATDICLGNRLSLFIASSLCHSLVHSEFYPTEIACFRFAYLTKPYLLQQNCATQRTARKISQAGLQKNLTITQQYILPDFDAIQVHQGQMLSLSFLYS